LIRTQTSSVSCISILCSSQLLKYSNQIDNTICMHDFQIKDLFRSYKPAWLAGSFKWNTVDIFINQTNRCLVIRNQMPSFGWSLSCASFAFAICSSNQLLFSSDVFSQLNWRKRFFLWPFKWIPHQTNIHKPQFNCFVILWDVLCTFYTFLLSVKQNIWFIKFFVWLGCYDRNCI
jgi:hypothetical protein